jgi:hypothetical protein
LADSISAANQLQASTFGRDFPARVTRLRARFMSALAKLKLFCPRSARGVAASATIILLAGAGSIDLAWATAPLPPRRPPEFTPSVAPAPEEQPPAPSNPAPQPQPESRTPAAAPGQRMPVDVDPNELKPFNLPPASRQRTRLCGERWRDLKLAGKSEGLTWRSFAEKCLPGKD